MGRDYSCQKPQLWTSLKVFPDTSALIALAARDAQAHIAGMSRTFEPDDYSFVVKKRSNPSKPWRWEIHRAGRAGAVAHSPVNFETMTMAHRAGKEALKLFLARRFG